MKAVNVYYDTHLGRSFRRLGEQLGKELKSGECAVFINAKKTACKILFPNGLLYYYKPESGKLTPEVIAGVTGLVAAREIKFSTVGWKSLLKEFGGVIRKEAA